MDIDFTKELNTPKECIQFLQQLKDSDVLFHLDDDPAELAIFHDDEIVCLRLRVKELFSTLHDPHAVALDILNGMTVNHNRVIEREWCKYCNAKECEGPSEDSHPCPYDQDVRSGHCMCNCCPTQMKACREDI